MTNATPAPAAATPAPPAPAAATPAPGRSKLAIAAQIAAVLGVVLCLAVIAATWFGRGQVAQGVDELSGTVDAGINRAIAAAGVVSARLDTASAEAGSLATEATQLAANPPPRPDALSGLSARLDGLANGYVRVRTAYAGIREDVAAAIASLRQVARFIPGVEVPAAPVDRLAALDANLQSIDETVTSIRPAGGAVTAAATSTVATAVAGKATAVQGVIDRTGALVDGLILDLEGVRANAARAASGIHTILVLTALVISILFVWILLLNLALWRLGRTHPRTAPAMADLQAPE